MHSSSHSQDPPSASPGAPRVVVAVSGEQDIARQEWLANELGAALEAGQPVLVDLTDAVLIDSVSLATILRAADRAQSQGQPFTICAPIGSLPRQVLSLLGASSRAHIVDDLNAALRPLRSADDTGTALERGRR